MVRNKPRAEEENEFAELYGAIKTHLLQGSVLNARERTRFTHDYQYAMGLIACTGFLFDKVQQDLLNAIAAYAAKERFESAANLFWLAEAMQERYEKLRAA